MAPRGTHPAPTVPRGPSPGQAGASTPASAASSSVGGRDPLDRRRRCGHRDAALARVVHGPRVRPRAAPRSCWLVRLTGPTATRPPRTITWPAPSVRRRTRSRWTARSASTPGRQRPEAVRDLLAERRDVLQVLRQRDPSVQLDLGGLERHVVGGDVGRDRDLDAHVALGDRRALAQRDRLLEHLDVQLEPDRRDVAGLLVAEQVAGAADLQIAHGDAQPAAELGVVGQRAQPRGRLAGRAPPRPGSTGMRGRSPCCGRRARGSGRAATVPS